MNKTLLKVSTDRFVQYCKDNGYGFIRLSNTMERVDKEEISIQDADIELYNLIVAFSNNFEKTQDAQDFIAEFKLPKCRYFHNVYACLTYLADQDNFCKGDSIKFLADYNDEDDAISSVLVLNQCDDIIADYVVLK